MTKMMLAALFALAVVPSLSAAADRKASTPPMSTDEARDQAGKEIAARRLAEACACKRETAVRDARASASTPASPSTTASHRP